MSLKGDRDFDYKYIGVVVFFIFSTEVARCVFMRSKLDFVGEMSTGFFVPRGV
jgi:hypothetical protein